MGAFAHGDGHEGMDMGTAPAVQPHDPTSSYFVYPEHQGLIMAHIGFMTIAWVFMLPVGRLASHCFK